MLYAIAPYKIREKQLNEKKSVVNYDMNEEQIIQFQAELNDFIDRLDALDPRFREDEDEDARWEKMADEFDEIEFGRAVMGA